MESLFAYVWKHSRRQQIFILLVVLVSFPFYYASLDLPRSIVNNAIQGAAFTGGRTEATLFRIEVPWVDGTRRLLFEGLTLDRIAYLMTLSGLFFLLVVINNGFKYVINMRKGALGERVLQQLRLDLFTSMLRATPEASRNLKAAEAATVIKDEVEPIGGFVGDAFIAPVFLGGQALTALAFIFFQNMLLGAIAGIIVGVQGIIIPLLRREQLRLARQRQIRSRALAGRIGEVVDGLQEVSNHGTAGYERSRVAERLDELFRIRYELYGRKFAVKFTNNLLAQLTPFLFYALGGYMALKGSLDIGQLVAVIAAYKDLPPPVRELIDWDQQRMDVAVKFKNVTDQFSLDALDAPDGHAPATSDFETGTIEIVGVTTTSTAGDPLLEGATATIPAGCHVALTGDLEGAAALAQILGRRASPQHGEVRIAGHPLSGLSADAAGRAIAYASSDVALFDGTLRDNLLYALRRPPGSGMGEGVVDYAAAGATGPGDVDEQLARALAVVGLDEAVYRYGLASRIDPELHPALSAGVVSARGRLRQILERDHASDLVEPFNPALYHHHSSIAENLLFGAADPQRTPVPGAEVAALATVVDATGLTEPLAGIGRRIAATMVELFADLPPDHPLFAQFSFLSAAELPRYEAILGRAEAGPLDAADRAALVEVSLRYVEPRHRLGLLDDAIRNHIVTARARVRSGDFPALSGMVDFFLPDRYCAAAPLRDNLLFGRVVLGIAGAQDRVTAAIQEAAAAEGIDDSIGRLGLDQPVGSGGRLLPPLQRAAAGLARCLVKRPRLLIVNGALDSLGEADRAATFARLHAAMDGRTLVAVVPDVAVAGGFDRVLAVTGGRLAPVEAGTTMPAPAAPPVGEDGVLGALRAVPLFASLDTPRLKLLAFTGEVITFRAGQALVEQGAASDCAYVVLDGRAEAYLEGANGTPIPLAILGVHAVVGEMGIVTGAPRSATVRAQTELRALRISRDIFMSLVSDVPHFALRLLREQVHRTVRLEERMLEHQKGGDAGH